MFYGIECQFASSFRDATPNHTSPHLIWAISLHQKGVFYPSPPAQATRTLKTSQSENGLCLINYQDQHATTIHSLENHPSEQFFHLWTGGLSKRFNAKNLHISIVPCFCISVLPIHPSRTVPQRDDPEIFVPVTKALQPSFEAPPMAPANMETLVAESTGCKATLYLLTLGIPGLNESFARLGLTLLSISWNIFCTLKLILKHFGMRLTADMNSNTLPYYCTVSHSCLLGFSLPESFPRSHPLQPHTIFVPQKHPACHTYN